MWGFVGKGWNGHHRSTILQKSMLVEIYKCLNGIGAAYLPDPFRYGGSSTRSNGKNLQVPRIDSVLYGNHRSTILQQVSKCIGVAYLADFFKYGGSSTRSNGKNWQVPRIDSVLYGNHSIRFHGTKLWAAMPESCKTPTSLVNFKTGLQSFTGIQCKCRACKGFPAGYWMYWPVLKMLSYHYPCVQWLRRSDTMDEPDVDQMWTRSLVDTCSCPPFRFY